MEKIGEFLAQHREALLASVERAFPPRVKTPENLPRIKRRYLGRQDLAVAGALEALKRGKAAFVVGEMGTGKTTVGAAVASAFPRTLVLCPPHLTRKWKREVEATIPNVTAIIAERPADLERARHLPTPLVVIVSRERAKLGPHYYAAVLPEPEHRIRRREGESPLAMCPNCGQPVRDRHGIPLSFTAARNKRGLVCYHCHAPLTAPKPTGPRRYPLAEYVKRRMRGFFDLLILDEAHEYKGASSAQGNAAGMLAEAIPKVLVLTGTLFGGYASTLFYLLWRFSNVIRREFGYKEADRFVHQYGAFERVHVHDDDGYGGSTRTGRTRVRSRELPSSSPLLLPYLLPQTVFMRLEDVATDLPPYGETVELVEPDPDLERWHAELTRKLGDLNLRTEPKYLGAYLQNGLHAIDTPWQGVEITDPDDEENVVVSHPLLEGGPWAKERRLVELVREERATGRRVLVFVQGTKRRDVTERLQNLLTKAGYQAKVLTSEMVSAKNREAWIAKQVKAGVEVLILHPRLVQTGLDLVDFPTIVFYQVEPSVYTLRQAARRSWRIGQKHPVKVVYLAYKKTMQESALALLASKAQASLALEGVLVEGGLATMANEDASVSLARALAEGKRLDLDPTRFSIATAGLPSEPPFQEPKAAPLEPEPQPLPLLPTADELGLTRKRRGKAPPAEAVVLFPEAFA